MDWTHFSSSRIGSTLFRINRKEKKGNTRLDSWMKRFIKEHPDIEDKKLERVQERKHTEMDRDLITSSSSNLRIFCSNASQFFWNNSDCSKRKMCRISRYDENDRISKTEIIPQGLQASAIVFQDRFSTQVRL